MPWRQGAALYRLYDADGGLLYIGIAENPDTRWKQHAKQSHWWTKVDPSRSRVEWYPGGYDAAAAEKAAIAAEDPPFNVVGSPRRTYTPKPKVAEIDGSRAVPINELRPTLGDRVDAAYFLGEDTVVTKKGKPRAVLVSHEWWQRMCALEAGRGNES
jgi:prevent-host-death family protein